MAPSSDLLRRLRNPVAAQPGGCAARKVGRPTAVRDRTAESQQRYRALTALSTFVSESFASPNSSVVFGS